MIAGKYVNLLEENILKTGNKTIAYSERKKLCINQIVHVSHWLCNNTV